MGRYISNVKFQFIFSSHPKTHIDKLLTDNGSKMNINEAMSTNLEVDKNFVVLKSSFSLHNVIQFTKCGSIIMKCFTCKEVNTGNRSKSFKSVPHISGLILFWQVSTHSRIITINFTVSVVRIHRIPIFHITHL